MKTSLRSMTGFARADGQVESYRWSWEIRTVNGKGLDLRVKLPPGWEILEGGVRAACGRQLTRGSVQAQLGITREDGVQAVNVNTDVLISVLAAMKAISQHIEAAPPRLDGLLALRGVLEYSEALDTQDSRSKAAPHLITGFEAALAALVAMRQQEGQALKEILGSKLEKISALVTQAAQLPSRQPEAIRARLAQQIEMLLETSDQFDSQRLHQEAVLIAVRNDICEELDRLRTHVTQAQELIQSGEAVGRRLDFLSQELHREANTLCAKSGDTDLTRIGIDLKTLIEQFREQVQNVE